MENNPLNLPEVIETQDLLKRLLAALIQEPCFNESITVGQVKAITQYLSYAYGMGFDEGRKQTAHRIPVNQIKNGVIIATFPSMYDAAMSLKSNKSVIGKAVKKKTKTKDGSTWELVNQLNN